MAISAFPDKDRPPDDAALARVLGAALPSWTGLLTRLEGELSGVSTVWRYGGRTVGWGLRVQQGTRTVVSLIPQAGVFLASLAMGEKAVRLARERGVAAEVLEVVDAAPRYAEGRGVRLPVRDGEGVAAALGLVAAKLA